MIKYPDKKVQKLSNPDIESSNYQNIPFDASVYGNPETGVSLYNIIFFCGFHAPCFMFLFQYFRMQLKN